MHMLLFLMDNIKNFRDVSTTGKLAKTETLGSRYFDVKQNIAVEEHLNLESA